MKRFHVHVSAEDRKSPAPAKSGEACCAPASAPEPVRFVGVSWRGRAE